MHQRKQRSRVRVMFEWRLTWNWTWLIPLLVMGSWWVFWAFFIAPQVSSAVLSGSTASYLLVVARGGLEYLLPLVSPLMAESLLPSELSQRTMTLLAMRTRLWAALGIRVPLAMLWMLGIAGGTSLAVVLWQPATAIWYWGTIWASVPPSLLMLAVALLASIALGTPRVGMLAAFSFWLANVFLMNPHANLPAPVARWMDALSTFSATSHVADAPITWEASKAIQLAVALCLLILTAMSTRGLGRLVRANIS